MFPLGSVLFPHAYLPLHVFEPRYQTLARHCLDGDGRFGVVLIERGAEVGGGDSRFEVGTVARVVEAANLPDGRWYLGIAGTHRVTIDRWLPDDPYPVAEVSERPEVGGPPDAAAVEGAVSSLRRALALRGELGEWAGPIATELSEDAAVASWQACALAPLTALDQQRLLAEDDATARASTLTTLLDEEVAVLRARLEGL